MRIDRKPPAPGHVPNPDRTHKFLTTRRYPLYCLPITKCASTFLKNLVYVLDNDTLHPDATNIHEHAADLMRADRTPPWMLRRSHHIFTVLRDPVSRLTSFYFDKIYRDGPQNFADLRIKLAHDIGLDLRPGLDAPAHRANLTRLTDWIAENLARRTDTPINPHWRPQHLRISAVAHFRPRWLTVDGLDEQLHQILGGIIPDLGAKIALVRSRNQTAYPVPPAEVVDTDLAARITAVYPNDAENYRAARDQWRAADPQPAPPVIDADTPALHVLTSVRFRVNAIVAPKAGSTYVRNLFYRFDHGVTHPDPLNIDQDKCLVTRLRTGPDLRGSARMFVIRDPVARFFSLYFDKVWGVGGKAFPWVAETLARNRRFHADRDLTEAEHHDNCCRLLGYLQTRFRERPEADLNPHWRPQYLRVADARAFGFQPVLLEDFATHARTIAAKRVRDLDVHLDALSPLNRSPKPIDPDKLASPWIMERLQALYGEDIALYQRIKAGWEATGTPPQL